MLPRSLPVRERGLKRLYLYFARIDSILDVKVAPRAGAWIETPLPLWLLLQVQTSLPVRERGLKHVFMYKSCNTCSVAPRAGAWIETPFETSRFGLAKSLPVRERGLKLYRFILVVASLSRSPCGSVD
ncbi:hypothetical protein SAMN05444162_2926 [Paenibacillaceae bacterium GAS479]|nr:hypothetical protein SAMN05444162_2926 [Paenibacillaceae bacterium GAS479]